MTELIASARSSSPAPRWGSARRRTAALSRLGGGDRHRRRRRGTSALQPPAAVQGRARPPGTPDEALTDAGLPADGASATGITWKLGSGVAAANLGRAHGDTRTTARCSASSGLVVATGLRPRACRTARPPGRTTCRAHPRRHAGPARRTGARGPGGVVGSGFIGCEIAATASGLGCRGAPSSRATSGPDGTPAGRRTVRRGAPDAQRPRRRHPGRDPRHSASSAAERCTGVLLADGTRSWRPTSSSRPSDPTPTSSGSRATGWTWATASNATNTCGSSTPPARRWPGSSPSATSPAIRTP